MGYLLQEERGISFPFRFLKVDGFLGIELSLSIFLSVLQNEYCDKHHFFPHLRPRFSHALRSFSRLQ